MCGIAGFWSFGRVAGEPEAVLRCMAAAVRHRGPDDEGYWWDPGVGIGCADGRLSIIDLSPEGRKPMHSASGRYVIVYNGEVYNFLDLRRALDGHAVALRGRSDTEVMLATIECRGLVDAVRRFAGMFAFALFDRTTRTLSLVRDRLGEKPLYYGWMGRTLLFGSELKPLHGHPHWQGEIDRNALALFLRHSYIPGPYSIYRGIRKVPPGTILTFRADEPGALPQAFPYWSARDAVERGAADPAVGTEEALTEQLDALLRRVV